jgi:hypothetical protein
MKGFESGNMQSDGVDAQFSGDDAWSREACLALREAARVGLALDEEQLLLGDVRDVQALYSSLRRMTPHAVRLNRTRHLVVGPREWCAQLVEECAPDRGTAAALYGRP